ncbi:MAG: VOC family protein [Pseudomonadota bacterium]|nr:VOC family protein [Pseudomonadota bacterium]
MGNPVGWFEIYVQDMGRARKFYEALFDTKLQKLDAPTGELEMWSWPGEQGAYGTPGALVKMKDAPSGGLGTLVYFMCDDCAVQEAKVPKLGGKIHREKMSIGEYGFITLAVDTEGNTIGLHSMK